jgi:hypothetical protein
MLNDIAGTNLVEVVDLGVVPHTVVEVACSDWVAVAHYSLKSRRAISVSE